MSIFTRTNRFAGSAGTKGFSFFWHFAPVAEGSVGLYLRRAL
jgi:hypothetical protein